MKTVEKIAAWDYYYPYQIDKVTCDDSVSIIFRNVKNIHTVLYLS